MLQLSLLFALAVVNVGHAQSPPNSFPHLYSGIPNNYNDFSDARAWQNYFRVKDSLPNVTFPLEESYAGNIPVNRPGHPNDTLFFWAFNSHKGSLTRSADENCKDPWMIWLNGGPGSSSMLGMLFENGPLHVASDYSVVENKFGWNTLADTIWVDQPVGTGFSTADSEGYIADDDQMGRDFMGFLSNLVKVFPSLAKRPLYLTGESYAGTWETYILKEYLSLEDPPVKLVKMAIGDGAIGEEPLFEDVAVMNILETYPQLINYDPETYNYFKNQMHLCGYDLNLTYPQEKPLPILRPTMLPAGSAPALQGRVPRSLTREAFLISLAKAQQSVSTLGKRDLELREENLRTWKRDMSLNFNNSINPFYQCLILFELIDFAVNFTEPWSINDPFSSEPGFDVYDIPDALDPEAPQDASVFLNNPTTRAALHAPTSKDWVQSIMYPFGNNVTPWEVPGANLFGDPSPAPSTFLTKLAADSFARNIPWVIYSGNDDLLVGHFGSEATIQNTTFGGTRGFTRRPSTPFIDDHGKFAGIVHQERNITYLLFEHAGHLVPHWQPERALTFVREFVLGNNPQGKVLPNGTVVGGETHKLKGDVLPGERNPIFTGSGTTMGSTLWPSATISSWDKFIATATGSYSG